MIRKKHFQQIVLDNFLQGIKPFPILNISRLKKSDYYEMAIKCYEELGGRQACPFISMPAWDVVIEKERKLIALQLDEAIHFNR
ncbi:MAG: hypothetical protein NZ521_10395, partial [Flammeovirgaceae bacterium]|nr:hypothetical protein [Flammeovirgaceae bacterium]MDW8288633.1 hypothetical protein [Flammeovirgaceae bacterium]